MIKSYDSNLSQSERLELCSGRFNAVILAPETLGTPASKPRFIMPSIASVRQQDARLMTFGSTCNVASEEESEEEESEEESLRAFAYDKRRDGMREHSLVLPSQRSMKEAYSEAYSYGYAND